MKLRVLAVALLAAIPAGAQARPRDAVVDALAKCTYLASDAERLTCFDHYRAQLRAAAQGPSTAQSTASSAQPAPAAGQQPMAQTPAPPSDLAWLDALNPFSGAPASDKPTPQQMAYQPIGGEILPVTIAIVSYTVAPSGSFTVTLANGQVWREHDRDFDTPPFRADGRNVVTITHAMLGGYNLILKGSPGHLYKVVRVK
jgi:hypothetical protein